MITVVDASVAAKWYVNENFTAEAEKLLDGSYDIHAPELMLPEFGSIIWKKARRGDLTDRETSRIINAFTRQNISYHSHQALIRPACTGAMLSNQTVYDWMYLTLAVSLSCKFVTADERFYNSLEKTTLGRHLVWVGDI